MRIHKPILLLVIMVVLEDFGGSAIWLGTNMSSSMRGRLRKGHFRALQTCRLESLGITVTQNIADNKNIEHVIVPHVDISLTLSTLNNKADWQQKTVHFSGKLSVPAMGLLCLWQSRFVGMWQCYCWGATGSCVANGMIVICGKPGALSLAHLSQWMLRNHVAFYCNWVLGPQIVILYQNTL